MTQIKSEKAKEYIMNIVEPKPTPDGELVFYIEMSAKQVVEAIKIAEAEAEERHAKELQSVHDMYKQIFFEHHREYESDKYHIGCNREIALQELKDKVLKMLTELCPRDLCTPFGVRVGSKYISCGTAGVCPRYDGFIAELGVSSELKNSNQ